MAMFGAGALVAMAGLWGVGTAVVTHREQITAQTERLLDATSPLDLDAVRAMLGPGTILTDASRASQLDLDRILSELDFVVDRWGVDGHRIERFECDVLDNGTGETRFRIRTALESFRPVRTTWRITWQLGGDGRWRMMELQWMKLENQAAQLGMWR